MTDQLLHRREPINENFIKHYFNINTNTDRTFGFVIHEFRAPDIGVVHDHPFGFASFIAKGWYVERIYHIDKEVQFGWWTEVVHREAGSCHRVEPGCIHEIIDMDPAGCNTMITPGHKAQDWRFWKFTHHGIFYRWPEEKEFIKYES